MIALLLTAAAFVLKGPVAGAVFAFVAVGLAVALWTPARAWLGIPAANDDVVPRPALRIGDPEVGELGPKGRFVRVPVINEPGEHSLRADGVFAVVRVDAPDGSRLITDVVAAWADASSPEISIEANGRARYIDTVTQEPNGHLYIWTDRGRGVKQVWGMLDQQAEIGARRCTVHVIVRGSNTEPLTTSFQVEPGIAAPRLVRRKEPAEDVASLQLIRALTCLIRTGADIVHDAEMDAFASGWFLRRGSDSEIAASERALGQRENEWTGEVERLLADRPTLLRRFEHAPEMRIAGAYDVAQRVGARSEALSGIRDGLSLPPSPLPVPSFPGPPVERTAEGTVLNH